MEALQCNIEVKIKQTKKKNNKTNILIPFVILSLKVLPSGYEYLIMTFQVMKFITTVFSARN